MDQPGWKFYRLPDDAPGNLPERVLRIVSAGFGFDRQGEQFAAGWIESTLGTTQFVGILGDDRGMIFYGCPETALLGRRLLWGDGMCVLPEVQGTGSIERVTSAMLRFLADVDIGWLGGRTQNPAAWRRFHRLGHARPFQGSYQDQEGQTIVRFLRDEIAQVRGLPDFEPKTGILRGALPRSMVPAGAKALPQWQDLDPESGDAVIFVVRLENSSRQEVGSPK